MSDIKRRPLVPDRVIDPRTLPKVIGASRGNLPHLFKDGCTYFVTFCLDDAVPDRLRRRGAIEDVDDVAAVAERSEPSLAHGRRILESPDLALIVEDALVHFQNERYMLSAWCVMPNHVHAVVTPYSGFGLSEILHSWKSFSAHRINASVGRKGRVWEKESFDHLVRHARSFEQFVDYTEANPVVAGLCDRPEQWLFSSARYRSTGE